MRVGIPMWRAVAVRESHMTRLKPTIGLEVHVQLAGGCKLFSGCRQLDDQPPNSAVAAFDMATPGTLPVLNRTPLALKAARLLSTKIPERSRFDRKHYFYADMPAGFQITQSEYPIARDGLFRFFVCGEHLNTYEHEVRIHQVQLEQDSGKTIHMGTQISLVDLNRAGAALIEIVTEPDLHSALEATCLVQQLRLLLVHHGISSGEMHKGHLRVDANVSLGDDETRGTRTEIKNINSLRLLHTAINYEIRRHLDILKEGGRVLNETRTVDTQGRTVSMRDKEEHTDYRIFAEPNLPWLRVKDEWLREADHAIAHSRSPKYRQFIDALRLEPRIAIIYAEDVELSAFVDRCLRISSKIDGEAFVFWLKELRLATQKSGDSFPPPSHFFAEQFLVLLSLWKEERLTKLSIIHFLKAYSSGKERRHVLEVAEKENLWRIRDFSVISSLLQEVLVEKPQLLERARAGSKKHLHRLRNELMARGGKGLAVDDAEEAVAEALSGSGGSGGGRGGSL